MVLNSYESIMTEAERPDFAEQSLGKCLNQPNTWANSGARKILFSTQFDQRLPLLYPEVPLVSTGYENQFGEYSSSYKIAKSEYIVLKKIKKFSFINDHYYLIIKNTKTNLLIKITLYKLLYHKYAIIFMEGENYVHNKKNIQRT